MTEISSPEWFDLLVDAAKKEGEGRTFGDHQIVSARPLVVTLTLTGKTFRVSDVAPVSRRSLEELLAL